MEEEEEEEGEGEEEEEEEEEEEDQDDHRRWPIAWRGPPHRFILQPKSAFGKDAKKCLLSKTAKSQISVRVLAAAVLNS